MREYVVKMIDSEGKVWFLTSADHWVANVHRAKQFAKGHATRIANIYARQHVFGVVTTELGPT